MKKSIICLAVFLASPGIFAGEATPSLVWSEIRDTGALTLAQPLDLGTLLFQAGARFKFIEQEFVETVPVLAITVQALECPDLEAKSEMTLVLPANHSDHRDQSVGVLLQPECILEIYVENLDLEAASIFNK